MITGCSPEYGVPDMTVISDIDETGINRNLQIRYSRDEIYVSFCHHTYFTIIIIIIYFRKKEVRKKGG